MCSNNQSSRTIELSQSWTLPSNGQAVTDSAKESKLHPSYLQEGRQIRSKPSRTENPKRLGNERNLRRPMSGGWASSLYRELQIPAMRPCSQGGPSAPISEKDKLEK